MSYTGPIIDAHHHLWDLSMGRHPWLASDGEVSGALPGLDRIARDFGVPEYRAGAAGQDIAATVHVEALWSGDPVEETRWLETLDKDGGIACRYVGAAPLGVGGWATGAWARSAARLRTQSRSPRFHR